jgi:hypothetical protein
VWTKYHADFQKSKSLIGKKNFKKKKYHSIKSKSLDSLIEKITEKMEFLKIDNFVKKIFQFCVPNVLPARFVSLFQKKKIIHTLRIIKFRISAQPVANVLICSFFDDSSAEGSRFVDKIPA